MPSVFTGLRKEVFVDLLQNAIGILATEGCNDYPIEVTKENIDNVKALIDDVRNSSRDGEYADTLLAECVVGNKVYFNDDVLLHMFKSLVMEA